MEEIKKNIKKGIKKRLSNHSPDFIIIGAQKAGTSSLHYYLNQHKNLSGSLPKEIHYFDRLINHEFDIKWYESHFKRKSIYKQLYFEATPSYIYHNDVPRKISKLYPNIKLILILREPARRAFSAWNMYRDIFEKKQFYRIMHEQKPGLKSGIFSYFFENRSVFPTFREAIEIEKRIIENGIEEEPAVLRRGLYFEQIENYLNYFSKDQILILGFKDLVENLSVTLNSICNFLEIEPMNIHKVNSEAKNNRTYKNTIDPKTYKWLQSYYSESNSKLFDFLGRKLNW